MPLNNERKWNTHSLSAVREWNRRVRCVDRKWCEGVVTSWPVTSRMLSSFPCWTCLKIWSKTRSSDQQLWSSFIWSPTLRKHESWIRKNTDQQKGNWLTSNKMHNLLFGFSCFLFWKKKIFLHFYVKGDLKFLWKRTLYIVTIKYHHEGSVWLWVGSIFFSSTQIPWALLLDLSSSISLKIISNIFCSLLVHTIIDLAQDLLHISVRASFVVVEVSFTAMKERDRERRGLGDLLCFLSKRSGTLEPKRGRKKSSKHSGGLCLTNKHEENQERVWKNRFRGVCVKRIMLMCSWPPGVLSMANICVVAVAL